MEHRIELAKYLSRLDVEKMMTTLAEVLGGKESIMLSKSPMTTCRF